MIDGVVVLDKAAGWTSHDVVAKCRGIFGQKKVGHSGTLDPGATGVLVLGLGRATRLLRFLTDLPKTYVAEVVMGVETTTLDADGEVTATHDMAGITLDDVRAAARGLTGDILQIPPMVSAVKVDGRRLHELAREGKEVERKPRPVTVHAFDVGPPVADGAFPIRVECSSGTYVRTLAADLGAALGGGAHLRALRRTAIGSFVEAAAVPIERVGPADVITPADGMADYRSVTVADDLAGRVRNGARLGLDELGGDGPGPWVVLAPDGDLLAVYEAHRGGAKPSVVLPPADLS